jgi:hypothetical protein
MGINLLLVVNVNAYVQRLPGKQVELVSGR